MSRGAQIALRPERCDHCGRCVPACSRRLVKVTGSHLYVDPRGCDGCLACVSVCPKGAIVKASGDAGRTVVGSRAEAKALKKAQKGDKAKTAFGTSVSKAAAAGAAVGRAPTAPVIGNRATVKASEPAKPASTAERRAATSVERPMPGAASWSLADAGIVLAVMFAGLLGNEVLLNSQAVQLMPEGGRIVARALALGGFALLQLIAVTVLARRHGMSLTEAFSLRGSGKSGQERIADAVLVVGLLVALRVFGLVWGLVARGLNLEVPAGDRLVEVFGQGPVGLGLSALIVVLVTPVIEELVFRGVVQKGLTERFSPWYAIAGSAAVFAAFHFTAWMFVPIFALGMAAGWLAWNRGSLWPAIALHAAYNGSAIAAALWIAR